MRRSVLLLGAIVAAAVIGATLGWRYLVAPVIGVAIWVWLAASLRSFARRPGGEDPIASDVPEPVLLTAPEQRTLYWCEECGTEYLLLVRGSGTAPRHCGTRMHERTEVARS